MNGPSTVSEEQDRPIVAYTLSGVRKAVGHGATAPEIGDVAAIIKQDGGESRAQVYSEYVAGRLAAMVGVTVAAGVFVAHARGLRYASLKIAEVGFALTDIDMERAEALPGTPLRLPISPCSTPGFAMLTAPGTCVPIWHSPPTT
jgi:hypothetical protein